MPTATAHIAGRPGKDAPAAPGWAASGSQPPSVSPGLAQIAHLLGSGPLLPLADLLLQREDRRAGRRAMRLARVAADRIFAVEHCRLPLHHLADVARRELRVASNPAPAFLDSLALAAIAAHRILGLRPHLAQMAAAVSVLQGRAAELGRGEGKSLALALAAAVRALGGTPVHLVLREDRDVDAQAALLRPFFGALGLGCGAVVGATPAAERREAYRADVCIATARELALDHLRDGHGEPHRHLHDDTTTGSRRPERACAFLDDIDALLIDEALAPFDSAGETRGSVRGPLSITPQAFFSRYAALGGTSSTLAEARRELASLYGMGVTTIASIYPCFRHERGLAVASGVERWREAVVSRVQDLVAGRRAVLVIAKDEAAGRMLEDALLAAGVDAVCMRQKDAGGLPVDASRAGPDSGPDAGPDAASGRSGQVTICVDWRRCRRIEVDAYARAAGGLAVVAAHVAATRREERRLGHLAGQRGQPGSSETIAALHLPGALAHLPSPVMRSFVHVRRYLEEWRAERKRSLHARRPPGEQVAEPAPSPRRAPHLQHEGS